MRKLKSFSLSFLPYLALISPIFEKMLPTASPDTHQLDTDNSIFRKAADFVLHTNENIFLTGKAGSGKTTFLKYIKAHTNKKCAVVAPTGVAAMNAGGETIHSFLQLPLSPFIPTKGGGGFGLQGQNTENQHSLLAKQRMRESKVKILRKLELLIIDEVSMVRCDLLDAMDTVLRHVRKNYSRPFGGVQVILIGDLFQLPPVANDMDWQILRNYYKSPYFFEAHVLREKTLLYIELKKIYRQKEQKFIDILNRIRKGEADEQDLYQLNKKCDPDFQPSQKEGYVILSTHNRTVDAINQQSLDQLGGQLYQFHGKIDKDFNTRDLPTDLLLNLKKGAQVMFIKNDTRMPRRYYNGKIGFISSLSDEKIMVAFPGDDTTELLELEKESWKNVRYTLNAMKGDIDEEEVGSFVQYPIKLAWAITVHKSQGLTLSKAIVDLYRSFAPGQVYVALSRCSSLDGLVLRSELNMDNIIVDERVMEFAKMEHDESELAEELEKGKRAAAFTTIKKVFSFNDLIEDIKELEDTVLKTKTGPREDSLNFIGQTLEVLRQAQGHAETFHRQVDTLFEYAGDARVEERKNAAAAYFSDKMLEPLITRAEAHILKTAEFPKIKKQAKLWKELKTALEQKKNEIANA